MATLIGFFWFALGMAGLFGVLYLVLLEVTGR